MDAESVMVSLDPTKKEKARRVAEILESHGAGEELIARWVGALAEASEDPDYWSWFVRRFNECVKSHGPLISREDNECVKSHELEAVASREEYERYVEEHERCAEELHRRRLLEAGVPWVYVDMEYTDIKPRTDVPGFSAALEGAMAFSADLADNLSTGRGLTFAGDPGTGKTLLPALILKAAVRANIHVMFVRAHSMFEGLKPGDDADSFRESLYTVPLVVVDDLGTEYRSEWTLCEFDALVSERHAAERSTIISTNYYNVELAKVYAPRVIDRLNERNTVFEFRGSSYRKFNK